MSTEQEMREAFVRWYNGDASNQQDELAESIKEMAFECWQEATRQAEERIQQAWQAGIQAGIEIGRNNQRIDDAATVKRDLPVAQAEPVAWSIFDKRTGRHWYTHESRNTAQRYADEYAHREPDGTMSMVVRPLYAAPRSRPGRLRRRPRGAGRLETPRAESRGAAARARVEGHRG